MQDDTVNCTTHTNLSNFASVPTYILQYEKIITFHCKYPVFWPIHFRGFFFLYFGHLFTY